MSVTRQLMDPIEFHSVEKKKSSFVFSRKKKIHTGLEQIESAVNYDRIFIFR